MDTVHDPHPTQVTAADPASFTVLALDPAELARVRATGLDHGGNPVEPFRDHDGGWPLRCCLTDSAPGDELAIVAWSPFPWRGPFAEVGPVVVHAGPCGGWSGRGVPPQFARRRQVLRPYGADRRIAYDLVRIVEEDDDLDAALAELVAHPAVEFVHARNVLAGCYSFTVVPT